MLKWRVAIREQVCSVSHALRPRFDNVHLQMGLESKVKAVDDITEAAEVEPLDEEEQMQEEVSRSVV